MNWVLWREYRLNRWILVLGAVSLLLPYATAVFFVWVEPVFDGVVPSASDLFGGAIVFSFAATQLALAILGGNSIAGERADRSAEFVAYLPVPRTRRLRAKWTLALSLLIVSWGVSSLASGILMLVDPEFVPNPEFWGYVLAALCFGATSLAVYGLCWLISSYASNPALAVVGGVMTPALAILTVLSTTVSESNILVWLTVYAIVSLAVACLCLWTGTRHYLNRIEP